MTSIKSTHISVSWLSGTASAASILFSLATFVFDLEKITEISFTESRLKYLRQSISHEIPSKLIQETNKSR